MRAYETYALIDPTGVVKNVVPYLVNTGGYTLATVEAVRAYGTGAFAVEITYCRAGIGDVFHDGNFYRVTDEGEELIPTEATEEEELSGLMESQADNDALFLDHEERLILLEVE